MHLSKKQLIILGAIAVLFLGFLIFLGSCNKRLAVPEQPQQAEATPAQEEIPTQDDPPSIPEPVVTTRSISTAMGDISVTETTEYDEALTYSRREYLSFDKSRIQACRVEGVTRQAALFTFQYQPIDATILCKKSMNLSHLCRTWRGTQRKTSCVCVHFHLLPIQAPLCFFPVITGCNVKSRTGQLRCGR